MVAQDKPEPLENLDPTAIARDMSVQDRSIVNGGLWSWGGETQRNPLLPAFGTKARDLALLNTFRNELNNMFKGVTSGIIKKVQSTPFEVRAPEIYGDYLSRMLNEADLGSGWATFIGKVILDFMRYDGGAFVELIGSGDPSDPLVTAPVAIANLDSLRCWITGDDEYPVWYYSADGNVYKMHYTRIRQLVDTPESDERHRGYGYCALSRAIASVTKDILMNRYVIQLMDDNPPPGFVLFSNIGEAGLRQAIEKRDAERSTDSGGIWGRSMKLFGLNQETMPKVEFITYSQPPIGFDYPTYQNQLAKEMANSIGVDINEFWELSGGNIGSSAQSEVMAQKSRGKTIGNLYKQLERLINEILPNDCEFVFEYQDPQANRDLAEDAMAWVGISASLADVLSADERRRLIANKVPAIADVITDDNGVITELATASQADNADDRAHTPDTGISPSGEDSAQSTDIEKSIASTSRKFESRFEFNVRKFMNGRISKYFTRQILVTILLAQGKEAYQDGKKIAKAPIEITPEDDLNILRWLNEQSTFLDDFLNDIVDGKITKENLAYHVGLWADKSLKTIYNEGMLQGDNNRYYMWVYHPTADHCDTCQRANGQIHRLRTWRDSGIMPQSSRLQCGGYNCKCRLIPIDDARQFDKGDLRSVKRTLKEYRHDHDHELPVYAVSINKETALQGLIGLLEGIK